MAEAASYNLVGFDAPDIIGLLGPQRGKQLVQRAALALNSLRLAHRQGALEFSGALVQHLSKSLPGIADILGQELGHSSIVVYHAAPSQVLTVTAAPYALRLETWCEAHSKGKGSSHAFKAVQNFPLQALFHHMWHHPGLCLPGAPGTVEQLRKAVFSKLLYTASSEQVRVEVEELVCCVLRYVVLQREVVSKVNSLLPAPASKNPARVLYGWDKNGNRQCSPDVRQQAENRAGPIAEELVYAQICSGIACAFPKAKDYGKVLAVYVQLPGDADAYDEARLFLSTGNSAPNQSPTLWSYDATQGNWAGNALDFSALRAHLQRAKTAQAAAEAAAVAGRQAAGAAAAGVGSGGPPAAAADAGRDRGTAGGGNTSRGQEAGARTAGVARGGTPAEAPASRGTAAADAAAGTRTPSLQSARGSGQGSLQHGNRSAATPQQPGRQPQRQQQAATPQRSEQQRSMPPPRTNGKGPRGGSRPSPAAAAGTNRGWEMGLARPGDEDVQMHTPAGQLQHPFGDRDYMDRSTDRFRGEGRVDPGSRSSTGGRPVHLLQLASPQSRGPPRGAPPATAPPSRRTLQGWGHQGMATP